MYDLRHTAGVLPSASATCFAVDATQRLNARSLTRLARAPDTTRNAIARTVAPQVRKSLAVNPSPLPPIASRR